MTDEKVSAINFDLDTFITVLFDFVLVRDWNFFTHNIIIKSDYIS